MDSRQFFAWKKNGIYAIPENQILRDRTARAMSNKRFRHVVFTINNWTKDDKDRLVVGDSIDYICYAEEVGEQGTPHLQGYCEFSKQLGVKAVKAALGQRAHFEGRKGTQVQAINYCKKMPPHGKSPLGDNVVAGVFFEFGEMKQQGKRNDLSGIYDLAKSGGTMQDLLKLQPTFQHIRIYEKVLQYKQLSTEYKKKEVIWCWGPTGTGKTRWSYAQIPKDEDFWVSNKDSAWFDGYYGQKYVIIDELRAGTWPYREMLRLLDGYEIRLPIKGSFIIWNPIKILITTPYGPEETYKGQITFGDGSIDQLLRRITEIKEFSQEKYKETFPEEIIVESPEKKKQRRNSMTWVEVEDLYEKQMKELDMELGKQQQEQSIEEDEDGIRWVCCEHGRFEQYACELCSWN